MPSEKNFQRVKELQEFLEGASIVIGTNYAGLSVGQMEGLRRALRESGCQYRVVRNRLVALAAENLGRGHLRDLLQGPVGLVVTHGDPAPAARALTTYVRTARITLPVTGAIVNGRVLSPTEVSTLANLPAREVLLAQALGTMTATMQSLVSVLHARLASIVNVLEQRRMQLEERS